MNSYKTYYDSDAGQIHAYVQPAEGPADNNEEPTLLCLHSSPTSGLFYKNALPLLNQGRTVIAPDYPGFGGSYSLTQPPAISDYAHAFIDSVLAAEPAEKFDLVGFHTGCLVAIELALLVPDKINKIILVDVPFFTGSARAGLLKKMSSPLPLTSELSSLAGEWETNITKRLDDLPLDRAFELLVESWRPGTRNHYAFQAAFSYDCETRFAQVGQPVHVMATRSGLLDATHQSAAALKHGLLLDIEDIQGAVFEKHVDLICSHINQALKHD